MNKRYINQNFFKSWSREMSYILGYITADGCIIKRRNRQNSYVLNITSKDKNHLAKIKKVLGSNCLIGKKYNSQGMACSQIQVCNKDICEDLIDLGILPRKTHRLDAIQTPKNYFPDFVRGFFDGDGTVYIYKVNNVYQIKAGFVSASYKFIKEFSGRLCNELKMPIKSIHQKFDKRRGRSIQYEFCFYINDCERLARFIYNDNPILYLTRKHRVFKRWESIDRRHYVKQNYPSKIGWCLNQKVMKL